MALNFPPNPEVGEVYSDGTTLWTWNGESWVSVTYGNGPAGPPGPAGQDGPQGPVGPAGPGVWVGDVPPTGPSTQGDLWWQPDDGQMYIYYDDGNSQQWVQVSNSSGGSGGASVWVGDEPPTNPLTQGDLWWKSNEGEMYIYYDDGDSQQWVQSTANAGPVGPAGPAGPVGPAGPQGEVGTDEEFY